MARILAVLAVGALGVGAAQGAVVGVGDSSAPWLAYMNVFELPVNGGGFVFGSPWGRNDLNTTFDDSANKLTLSPNTIGDPSDFWYIGGGGPGAPGNKIMEANLYMETTGVYVGETLTFEGFVQTNTFTSAHSAVIFIKDFAPDYSSSVTTTIPVVPGPFSLSLLTIADPARHVQWGFQVTGACVWFTDVAPFGNAMITTVPGPGALAVFGLVGLAGVRRRRA